MNTEQLERRQRLLFAMVMNLGKMAILLGSTRQFNNEDDEDKFHSEASELLQHAAEYNKIGDDDASDT